VSAPEPGTLEYRWWKQGTEDEAEARNEGMSRKHLEVREVLESLARMRPELTVDELLVRVTVIYMAGLPLRWLLKHAWRLIK
jgi:hypothetical protein